MSTTITAPGRTFVVVPAKAVDRSLRPRRFRDALTIGPIAFFTCHDDGGVEHGYNDAFEQGYTGARLTWILENATNPFAIQLRAGTRFDAADGSTSAINWLVLAFTRVADERAFLTAFPRGAA